MTIQDRISEAMAAKGLTTTDLATLAGATRSEISQLLDATPENLFKIADALGYEARYLATGQGPKTRRKQ